MADNYVKSNSIGVFPSVFRTYTPAGKFTNETNFANIVKSVVDRDSYVLSYKSNILRLVIFGYYFVIEGITSPPLWAAIRVAADTLARCYNLVNYDDSSVDLDTGGADSSFKGIRLGYEETGKPSASETIKVLQIVENGKINYNRISTNSIYYPNASGDPYKNLTEVLDGKQEKLNANYDEGLQIYTGNDNQQWIKIRDDQYLKLRHLTNMNTVSDTVKPFTLNYFDNAGLLKVSKANAGYRYKNSSSQSVYLANGVITPGQVIYYSTNAAPTTAGDYHDGDIWIRYSNT